MYHDPTPVQISLERLGRAHQYALAGDGQQAAMLIRKAMTAMIPLLALEHGEPETAAPAPLPNALVFTVVSETDPTVTYDVTLGSCTCKDFEHRGHQRPCKHINSLRAQVSTQTSSVLSLARTS